MKESVYLRSYLAPFERWLNNNDVTDILVNRPGEIWIETASGVTSCEPAPDLTETILARLARQIAGLNNQGVNREHPLLSATLPGGERVQIVAPPATRQGLALAIRKHVVSNLSLEELDATGIFARSADDHSTRENDCDLEAMLDARKFRAFLEIAVRRKKTIVISGGTSSGKTTLLNALMKLIDGGERLIVIEDTPEVKLEHANSVGLVVARGDMGEARIDTEDLLEASLRMRPDRIFLGELRGREAFTFLRAVNTGHPGSITTVHADSPDAAFEQMTMMALLSNAGVDWRTVETYARKVVDVVVQMKRAGGIRYVSQIIFKPMTEGRAREWTNSIGHSVDPYEKPNPEVSDAREHLATRVLL